MKNTKGKWGVHNPIYQGKKMTAKGSVSVVRVKDSSSPTGWKYPRYIPDNKICEFVEWGEKDRANANLIASAPEMLSLLKRFLKAPAYEEARNTTHMYGFLEEMKAVTIKADGK